MQTAMVGGGLKFSLYFPCQNPAKHLHLVSLSGKKGYFLYPADFYRPSFIDVMPLGFERLETFYSFEREMLRELFPLFCAAFPLAESLGEKLFLSSVLFPSHKVESSECKLSLPERYED